MTGDDGTLDLFDQPWAFSGEDFDEDRDGERLAAQIRRVYAVIADEQPRTLVRIQQDILERFNILDPHASISAQLRNLRKAPFGSHQIEREYLGDGLYTYRLVQRVH